VIINCYLTFIQAKFLFSLLMKIPDFVRLLLVKMILNLFVGLLLKAPILLPFNLVENDLSVFLFAINSTRTIKNNRVSKGHFRCLVNLHVLPSFGYILLITQLSIWGIVVGCFPFVIPTLGNTGELALGIMFNFSAEELVCAFQSC
jgi:hypothetical protein